MNYIEECLNILNIAKKDLFKTTVEKLLVEINDLNYYRKDLIDLLKNISQDDAAYLIESIIIKNPFFFDPVELEELYFILKKHKFQKSIVNILKEYDVREDQIKRIIKDTVSKKETIDDKFDLPNFWTDDQKNAYKQLIQFFNEPNVHFMTLCGYAGTGKSSLCSQLILKCTNVKFLLSATTHKAAQVLSEMMSFKSDPVVTIHQSLNLILTESGLCQYKDPKHLQDIDVLLVDECSMLNKETMTFIYKAVADYGIKFLFVGDDKQLPPVNENASESFTSGLTIKLKKIVRQAEQNALVKTSLLLRESIDDSSSINSIIDRFSNQDESLVIINDQHEWIELMVNRYKRSKLEEFNVMSLAWTNNQVEKLNKAIHTKLSLGGGGAPFYENSLVLVKSPIFMKQFSRKTIVFSSNEICFITKIEEILIEGYLFYEIYLKSQISEKKGKTYFTKMSHTQLNVFLANYNKNCLQLIKSEKIEKNDFVSNLNIIQHLYALTVHRSQGVSCDECFVDVNNILLNNNNLETKKMLYVALTRARKNVYCFI